MNFHKNESSVSSILNNITLPNWCPQHWAVEKPGPDPIQGEDWIVVMAQAFLPHMESFCVVLWKCTNCVLPLQLVWETDSLFPSTFINSDEEIISRSSAVSISSYLTHTHTSSYSPNASALLPSRLLTELPVTAQIDGSPGRTPDPQHRLIYFADLTTSEPLAEVKGSDKLVCTWFISH